MKCLQNFDEQNVGKFIMGIKVETLGEKDYVAHLMLYFTYSMSKAML